MRDFQAAGINVIQKLNLLHDRIEPTNISPNAEAVVLAGGDGTVSGGIVHLLRQDLPVGIVPLGTGNAFVRDVGIPLDRTQAVRIIATGAVHKFDVGLANDSPFLNACTLGLTSKLVNALRKEDKRRFGWGAYPMAVVRAGLNHPPYHLTLRHDGEVEQIDVWQAIILNGNSFGGLFSFGEGARPDDGLLHCLFLRSGSLASWIRFIVAMRKQRPYEHNESTAVVTSSLDIGSPKKAKIVVDGELKEATPCRFRIERKALPVIVPPRDPSVL